jgi:glycosyltransferase involved in cell wall biosynthesis
MPEKNYNFYSLIIPSFNRAEEVDVLLASLSKLDFSADRFEVIIADDGSTDNTESIVDSYKKRIVFPLYYYTQKNQGPGAARNLGMKNAKGDFFIFVDSDVSVPCYWLTNIDTALNKEKADAFGGPDTFLDDFPALLKAINYSMTSFITTGGLRGKKGKKLAKYYPRSFNMGLSRDLWKQIGGFGSLRHGQDIEFSNRIIRSGAHVIFVDNAEVFHKRRTNLKRFYKQVFNWGVARINLYKIDKSMLEPLHLMPAIVTFCVAMIIILAFIFEFFTRLALAGLVIGVIILIICMIDSIKIYKSIIPALYLPLVMPAQIIGYGLGFIYNFIRRVIFNKEEKVGFKKHYYK